MSQADLEISLFPRQAESYGLALRFRHPVAGQDKSASGSFALDAAELRQRQHDPVAYGEQLAGQLFASPGVRSFLDLALAAAAGQQTSLHLRLFISADAQELHSLRWETLRLPGSDAPLAAGEWLRFSRYLDGKDWRPAPTVERDALRALVAVASPDVGGTTLAEVRTEDELAAARAGLGDIPSEALAGRGQVTLANLLARLRDGCDILYLVAHGMLVDGEPQILLEREDGGRAWTSGRELAARIGELAQPPELVLLVSCQSAGSGGSESTPDGGALAGLGPRLAAAGVPAVVAMQGNLTMATAAAFVPVFLRELRRDGQVDRAMAVARGAVRERPDWWMPALYTRLEDGRVFDLTAMLPPPPCPYPGMVPFCAEDSRFFYGREGEIQQILDHLRHQRLLLVIGPSGSGKSSLIAAGLLPRLEKSTYFAPGFWLVRTMRPLDHPVAALAACLEGDVSQPEQAVAELLAAHAPAQRLLLVIDQFEEAFSLADKTERQQLMAALQALRRSQQCALVIALRADFYPDLMNSDLWPVDPGQRLDVTGLRGGALRQAIRQPASDVEVEIDEALIERLLADAAGEPGALPMLQETLVLLWERMRRRQITLGDYERLGEGERSGLAVAVARKADATVAELTPAEQLIAQRIFLRLIQFGEGRRDTRRQLPAADLRSAADDNQAFEWTLEHLARNRLLTLSGEQYDAARRVDISHETLISDWPRLQVWLRERKEAELARRRFEDKSKEWVRLGRGEGGMLDKEELAEVDDWLAGQGSMERDASAALLALVEASRKAINPGWHRKGVVALTASGIAILALAALLPIITVGLAWPLRSALFLTGGLLLVFLAWSTGLLRRNDAYRLQHLSQAVVERRWAQPLLLLLTLVSIASWAKFGISAARTTDYCSSLGYTDASGKTIRVAVSASDLDPYYLKLVRDEIETHPDVHSWIVQINDAERCSRYFSYFVELQRDSPPGGEEIGYSAEVRRDLNDSPIRELAIRSQAQCDLFVEIGQKVLNRLPVAPNQVLSQQEGHSQIASCQAFMQNQEGYAAYQQGNYAQARRLLQETITLEPGFAVAHNNLGLVHLREGNYNEAYTEFAEAVNLWPANGLFLLNQGRACYRLRDYECAETSYRQSIQREMDNPTAPHVLFEAYHNLSVLYREWDRLAEADQTLSEATSLLGSISDVQARQQYELSLLKNRGILRFRERRWDDAIELLLDAEAFDGTQRWTEEILYYLALAYESTADQDQACVNWLLYNATPSAGLFNESERRRDAAIHQSSLGCRK